MTLSNDALFAALREGLALGHDDGVEAELDLLCGKKGWTVTRVVGGYEVTAPTLAQWSRLPTILHFLMYGGVSLIQTPRSPHDRACRLLSRADSESGLGLEILFTCAEAPQEDDDDAPQPPTVTRPASAALSGAEMQLHGLLVGAALDHFTLIGGPAGVAELTIRFVHNPGQGARAWPARLSLRCEWEIGAAPDGRPQRDTLPIAALDALCQTGAVTVRDVSVRGPDLRVVFEDGATLTTRVNTSAVGEAWIVTKTTWEDAALPRRVASEGGEIFVQAVQLSATPELRAELTRRIRDGAPLLDLHAALRRWRDLGLTQTDALAALETLRAELQSETEDNLVTDLMDFVVGFCAPNLRLY